MESTIRGRTSAVGSSGPTCFNRSCLDSCSLFRAFLLSCMGAWMHGEGLVCVMGAWAHGRMGSGPKGTEVSLVLWVHPPHQRPCPLTDDFCLAAACSSAGMLLNAMPRASFCKAKGWGKIICASRACVLSYTGGGCKT